MSCIAGFHDPALVAGLAARLHAEKRGSEALRFMEVCGTHTMAIYRHGIRSLLPPWISLVSGPGCPVCVTPNIYLDQAIEASRTPGITVATFGDMMRVPGSGSSLIEERARGADVRVVHSPLDALELARREPARQVVFLGVGFETTAPAVAATILAAEAAGAQNFLVLSGHKTIPAAMRLLASDPEIAVDGFLCPAHVSAIIGAQPYRFLAQELRLPCVITGFDPVDIMQGVSMLVEQRLAGSALVENQYSRVVREEGNRRGVDILESVFEPCDATWRGIGEIPGSGLRIRERFARFDAEQVLELRVEGGEEREGCRCGDIMRGKLAPTDCPLFGAGCTPRSPVGPCMVSSEGTCAAAWRYGA